MIPRPMADLGVADDPVAFAGDSPRDREVLRSCTTSLVTEADWFRNGELETSELVAMCLYDELVRRGPEVERGDGPGSLVGELMSRLLIWSGDQPLAEEEMMLFLAAAEAEWVGEVKLIRGDVGVGEVGRVDMLPGAGERGMSMAPNERPSEGSEAGQGQWMRENGCIGCAEDGLEGVWMMLTTYDDSETQYSV